MSKGSSDDSDNFDDMLDGYHEKDQIHLVSRVKVVVLIQVRLAFLLYCISIGQLTVNIIQGLLGGITIRVESGDEASPKKRLHCDQTAPITLEVYPHQILQQVIKEDLIFNADEPVLEDSGALVGP